MKSKESVTQSIAMKKYQSVQQFFDELECFQIETVKLRRVVQSMGLEETLKWSMPVYVGNGKNVVGIFVTKTYFGLWFYQGALLKDENDVLMNAQKGKTKALRQWRMTSEKDIKVRLIKKYILEASALAAAGKEIKPNRNKPVIVPVELTKALSQFPGAKKQFEAMTKGRRREYADYIAGAKRVETKQKRIDKIIPMILDSVGLNDKYR